jgi:hypothetical protein
MDTVSGMDGVVVNSHVTHSVQPAGPASGGGQSGQLIPLPNPVVHETVFVKLDDGTHVQRSPKVLVSL